MRTILKNDMLFEENDFVCILGFEKCIQRPWNGVFWCNRLVARRWRAHTVQNKEVVGRPPPIRNVHQQPFGRLAAA